jgi:hypothetical protein
MAEEASKINSEIKYLAQELNKTGFPIEMEIFNLLNSRNWLASPNDYYYDDELNLGRDIDIHATPYPYQPAKNFFMFPFLAIECKKSQTMAWVFFEAKVNYSPLTGRASPIKSG